MTRVLRSVAKAVVALAGALGVALADGHVTPAEVCAVLVTVGGVYGITNTPPEER